MVLKTQSLFPLEIELAPPPVTLKVDGDRKDIPVPSQDRIPGSEMQDIY